MRSFNTGALSESQNQADIQDENPYAVILEMNTEIKIGRGSFEKDSPYATHTIIMSNPAETVTRNQCSWFSWKRFCVGVLFCFVIASATTTGVVVTLYVKTNKRSSTSSTISTTPNATIHSSTWTSPRTRTRSPTTNSTTSPTTTMTTSPTTKTTMSTTPSPTDDCSTPHRCHSCSSREVNGRCKANGQLVDTVKFGMSEVCSVACYAEVRPTDKNYVHRGCVDSQGSKVEALVDPENLGCFPFEKLPGTGNSTYCFCCGDLCNTQDMTQYGGIDI